MTTATPRDVPGQTFGGRSANEGVRPRAVHRDEIERHRLISADGYDTVVTTIRAAHGVYLTGAYPIQQGYLVMICQPYFEAQSATVEAAAEQHEQLVQALAEAGVGIVRARRRLAARQRAEQREATLAQNRQHELAVQSSH
jgi:hypothetical protein